MVIVCYEVYLIAGTKKSPGSFISISISSVNNSAFAE